LTPKARRENISGIIGRTDAREKTVIAAGHQSGARLLRGEAAIFVPGASPHRAALLYCRYARKNERINAETQRTLRNRREEMGNHGESRESLKNNETNWAVPHVYMNKSREWTARP